MKGFKAGRSFGKSLSTKSSKWGNPSNPAKIVHAANKAASKAK